MSRAEWFAVAVILLLVLGAVWLLGLISTSSPGAPYKPGVVACVSSDEDRERLTRLSVEALDDAYKDQIAHLYTIWMRDPRDQPRRAQAGVSQATTAWLDARKAAGDFRPPLCP